MSLEIDDEKLDIPPCVPSSVEIEEMVRISRSLPGIFLTTHPIIQIIPVAMLEALLPGIILTTHPIIQGW